MSQVETRIVGPEDTDLRLDRWFRRHFPDLTHIRLERLLRTGQVRVDGKRAKAGLRITTGQAIRVPPLGAAPGAGEEGAPPGRPAPRPVSPRDVALVQGLVLHRDDDLLVLNKPAGLAVQGGTGTTRHLDGLLDALRFGSAERPRLVHRLDRDTSGVLVVARTARAATLLAEGFRAKAMRKVYWAVVVGAPKPRRGRIDQALVKRGEIGGERVVADDEDGRQAVTWYTTVETAAGKAAWLALLPETGRTHQLRAHCSGVLGTPILGDRKYGGERALLPGLGERPALHLHARAIRLPHPRGGTLSVTAPLPPHMVETWSFFGFAPEPDGDPFAELEA